MVVGWDSHVLLKTHPQSSLSPGNPPYKSSTGHPPFLSPCTSNWSFQSPRLSVPHHVPCRPHLSPLLSPFSPCPTPLPAPSRPPLPVSSRPLPFPPSGCLRRQDLFCVRNRRTSPGLSSSHELLLTRTHFPRTQSCHFLAFPCLV